MVSYLVTRRRDIYLTSVLAITRAVFRLHETPPSVYYGTIVAPRSSLPEAAAHISRFSTSVVDPGVSLFMFIQKGSFQGMHKVNFDEPEALVFQMFDTNGEAHGRQTFKWALDLPGAQDFTRTGTILEVIRIQGTEPSIENSFSGNRTQRLTYARNSDRVASISGRSQQYFNPIVVPEFTEDQVQTCAKWFSDLGNRGDSIADNTFMVFELFVTVCRLTPSNNRGHLSSHQ